MQLASGNYIGAAFGILSKILATILNMKDLPDEPSWKRQLEAWDKLIERQERLIELSERAGGTEKALQKKVDILQKEVDRLEKVIAEQRARRATPDELKDTLALLDQARTDLFNAEQDLADFITGGITENIIADTIAQGFIDGGKYGVDKVAEYMTDVLKNAAIEIFKGQILDNPQMKAYLAYIKDALSDNVLTPEEKERIDQMGRDFAETMGPVWDTWMKVFGTDQGDTNSLTGAIKGINEEQASLLAGQTNAIRIAQATANNTLQSSLTQLMIISDNTSYLKSIDKKLDALKNNPLRAQGVI
jgi:hypothetical protein